MSEKWPRNGEISLFIIHQLITRLILIPCNCSHIALISSEELFVSLVFEGRAILNSESSDMFLKVRKYALLCLVCVFLLVKIYA